MTTAATSKQQKKLSKDVTKAIGAMPPWVWDPSYVPLHDKALPEALDEDDEEQSFRQFIDMGKREPNERGTGRWLVTEERKTIAIVCIGEVAKETLEGVKSYLAAFFHGMEVESHQSLPDVQVLFGSSKKKMKNGTKKTKTLQPQDDLSLIMGTYVYSIQHEQVHGEQCFDVFSLFDMLVHAIDETSHYCVIALVNHGLCEQVDNEYLPVLGRACGDRVCVVDARNASATGPRNNNASVSPKEAQRNLRTLLATTAHEILHCFGLDHCTTWECVMNSQQVEDHEFLFLSPLNLKKLVYAMLPADEIKRNVECVNQHVIHRYKLLGDALKDLGFSKDASWSYRKASLVEQTTTRDPPTLRAEDTLDGGSRKRRRKLK